MRTGTASTPLLFTLLVSACLFSACDGPTTTPIVLPDGAIGDAGPLDASPLDAGPLDADLLDAGPRVAVRVESTGALHVARFNHTATRLPSGRVLFIGGEDLSRVPNASIEEYDPETGTFTEVATLATPRASHTATLLADGRVLIAGGGASSSNGLPAGRDVLATAVLYDPSTHALTETGALAHARGHHAALALADGRVLVAGGAAPGAAGGFSAVAALERFDPATGTWSDAGTLAVPRALTHLVADDGGALVIGGLAANLDAPAEVERFDAASGAVTPAGTLAGPGRIFHSTLRTSDGTVLVVGGLAPPVFLSGVDARGPSDDAFRALAELPSARNSVGLAETEAAVLAIGGFFYSSSAGGQVLDEVLALDPTTGRFEVAGALPVGRAAHTATALESGAVLIAGGYSSFGVMEAALLVHAE